MFVLLKKELSNFFSSAAGFIIIAVFLTLTGSFLWLIPSEYNVLDSGYANVDGLFMLSPWLFLFLVPALTMKMFSDERSSGTIELLYTKPLSVTSIVLSKFFASWILTIVALIPTLLYMVSVGLLGVTPFNLDSGAFWGSFIGLAFLASGYTAIGLFCSSVSKNSIVSFVLAALLCFIIYTGFDFLSLLFPDATTARWVSGLGIASHYDSMSRGVIDLNDVWYFVLLSLVFLCLTVLRVKGQGTRVKGQEPRKIIIVCVAVAFFSVISTLVNVSMCRFDLTQEKRYSISENTKQLVRGVHSDVNVDIYLDGDMNSGFLRLKEAAVNLLKEMSIYWDGNLNLRMIDPSSASDSKGRSKRYFELEQRGLKPTMVYDRDASGGMIQKVLFPWAVVSFPAGDTVNVNLLKNIQGMSGEENLNASIESLEYEFTDAIRRATMVNPESVAFLEGHNEFAEQDVLSITKALSAYYNVDRGVLGTDASVLDKYKAVIIAGPLSKFSETDKFIIDQYIMYGGCVLWLIDGVRTDKESVGIANDISLEDMLFTYGVRISPLLLLDTQCALVPVNTSLEGEQPKFEPMPWYYSPILIPNPSNAITRNLSGVRADFSSVVELVGENKTGLEASALLFSSAKSGLDKAPMQIDMSVVELSPESPFFSFSYLPVSVMLKGRFPSVFANRMTPPDITSGAKDRMQKSVSAKMIVVADGDVIRDDISVDKYSGQTYGNEQFILNAVNYLTDDEGWLELRGREWKLRLLDKKLLSEYRVVVQIVNTIAPLVLLIIFVFVYQMVRKKRWQTPLRR